MKTAIDLAVLVIAGLAVAAATPAPTRRSRILAWTFLAILYGLAFTKWWLYGFEQ
ncbi:MAG TPA: hypothetical protein VM493_01290 [Vicinamibacterales bacterium]|jgi:hypothetical protein|nr:hypothetical protein [Vicinamibacterales bacterium]